MKNQYFGDVNDYRKYGLLRLLGRAGKVKIGVCWMLTRTTTNPMDKRPGISMTTGDKSEISTPNSTIPSTTQSTGMRQNKTYGM